ncbi:MAG: hypothetical protein U0792_12360 [Gemmataceae bacterium]
MTTPQEASRRRRIVYHAALTRLPNDMVSAAVRLCDREFQAAPVFSVQKFLTRLTEALGPPPKPGELFAAMNRLRVVTDLDAIGPDPIGGETAAKSPPSTSQLSPVQVRPPSTPAFELRLDSWPALFGAFLNRLLTELDRLRSDLPALAREGVGLRLQRVDLGPQSYQELNAWVDGQASSFTNKVALADMRTALHEFYVWLCEELGPIECDRLFGGVIRELSTLPGAVQFPPRSLL